VDVRASATSDGEIVCHPESQDVAVKTDARVCGCAAGISFKKLVVVYPHGVREHASALDLKVLYHLPVAQACKQERRQSRRKEKLTEG
jgi:hypothetical protein